MNPNLSSITPCSFQGIAASIPPHLCSRCPRYPVYSMCPVCTADAERTSACATSSPLNVCEKCRLTVVRLLNGQFVQSTGDRTGKHALLPPQRAHGIDPRSSPRRDV